MSDAAGFTIWIGVVDSELVRVVTRGDERPPTEMLSVASGPEKVGSWVAVWASAARPGEVSLLRLEGSPETLTAFLGEVAGALPEGVFLAYRDRCAALARPERTSIETQTRTLAAPAEIGSLVCELPAGTFLACRDARVIKVWV